MASLTTLSTLGFGRTSNLATPNCIVSLFACQFHFLRLFSSVSQFCTFFNLFISLKLCHRRGKSIFVGSKRLSFARSESGSHAVTAHCKCVLDSGGCAHPTRAAALLSDSGGTENSNFITGGNASPFRNPLRNINSRLFCDDDVFETNGRSTLRRLLRFQTRAAREKKRSSGDAESEEREMSKAGEPSNCKKIDTKR